MTHDQSRVRITGPLEPFGDGFAEELARQGYTPKSAALLLRLMAHLSRWMVDEALDSHKLSPSQVERFVDARRAAGYTNHLTSKALQPMLIYLRGLRVGASAPLSTKFCRYFVSAVISCSWNCPEGATSSGRSPGRRVGSCHGPGRVRCARTRRLGCQAPCEATPRQRCEQ